MMSRIGRLYELVQPAALQRTLGPFLDKNSTYRLNATALQAALGGTASIDGTRQRARALIDFHLRSKFPSYASERRQEIIRQLMPAATRLNVNPTSMRDFDSLYLEEALGPEAELCDIPRNAITVLEGMLTCRGLKKIIIQVWSEHQRIPAGVYIRANAPESRRGSVSIVVLQEGQVMVPGPARIGSTGYMGYHFS